MTLKIIHKRSTDVTGGVSDAPLPTDIEHGEIGINYADADPALFIKDSADVVRRLPLNASEENKKYSIANDDAGLVGADATAAINAALIANGDIADVAELGVSDQCDVTDSGNPDANPEVTVGRYWYDGAVWFLGGGNTLLTVSDTAPSNPIRGQLWVDTNEDPPVVKVWDDTPGPGAWVPVGIEDAPNDGQQYARQSEAWTVVQGDVEEAPIDGQQYARQDAGWSVVTGGSGGITYSGAAAWGNVASDGTLNNGLNIASVTKTATGTYSVTFVNPMPDDNYSVTVSSNNTSNKASYFATSTSGFEVYIVSTVSSGAVDGGFSFAVHATNALPPKGGTGTDAWATVDLTEVNGPCNVPASFNVASVTRTGGGRYDVVFTTPMPTANYGIQTSPGGPDSQTSGRTILYRDVTANGFGITIRQSSLDSVTHDNEFSFTVNATNANLPYTFTKEQIEAAINNTGAYAWASTAIDGTIEGSNGLTCTKQATGDYLYTFNTPLPDANYAVTAATTNTSPQSGWTQWVVDNRTSTGFRVLTGLDSNGSMSDQPLSVVVTAAKGQPLSLGGGADAWGQVTDAGVLTAGFNCTVSKTNKWDGTVAADAPGAYYVTFTNPMPTANYSVTGSITEQAFWDVTTVEKDARGFSINIVAPNVNSGANIVGNAPFDFSVFATDGNAGGFWARSNDGVLTPANSTDDVQIASLNGGQLAGFRNILCNGTVTINQRGLTYAGVAVGEYWADRWKKTAGGMTQIIEEGNYKPNTEYTLSGTGVTTQQITSPASGNWTIPDVPETATMIQLEEGPIPSPYELKPIQTELALCQRYYQSLGVRQTTTLAFSYTYQTAMRTTPTGTTTGDGSLVLQSSAFVVGSAAAAGGITVKLDAEL